MYVTKPLQLESLHHPCTCPALSDISVDQSHHHAEKHKLKLHKIGIQLKQFRQQTKTRKKTLLGRKISMWAIIKHENSSITQLLPFIVRTLSKYYLKSNLELTFEADCLKSFIGKEEWLNGRIAPQ